MDRLREDACKKYKSRRLVEAYICLKNLSSNSLYAEQTKTFEEQSSSAQGNPGNINNHPSIADLISINALSENKKPHYLHSVSITAGANIDDEIHLQKFRSETEASSAGKTDLLLRSKSTIETSRELKSRIKLTSPSKLLFLQKEAYDKRLILTSSHKVPYYMFSIVPYKSNRKIQHEKHSIGQSHFPSIHHYHNIIENVDIGDGKREVSFGHLLIPESWKKKNIQHDGCCPENEHQHTHETSEYHTVEYDPMMLDDPELTCGKHRKVLTLTSYTVSIIPYAKPSEVKKDVNEQFKEKYPNLSITLSKLRSIKSELMQMSQKMNLEIAVLANAFVYFEKAILRTKLHKGNRKCIAGACLLLSIKFFDDVNGKNVKPCIEVIKDQFKVSHKDLLSCELQLLVLLEFSLQTPHYEVSPMYKRLETLI